MIHFFDTSAFVKRYVREEGSAEVRRAFRSGSAAIARITHAEALAAIARAWRERLVTSPQRDRIFGLIERDVGAVAVVELRPAVVASVRPLVERHPLRGYDAVQLACALAVKRAGAAVTFWSADQRLCAAAVAEGLRAQVPG